ncbi:MAG: CRTAC1 family protein [Thermoanaerobaculia bacterium]
MIRTALTFAVALAASSQELDLLPTPQETRAELEKVCHELKTGDNPYLGNSLARQLSQRLELPITDPEVQVGIRGRLAEELLRLGDADRAVRLLGAALEIATDEELGGELGSRLLFLLGLAYLQLAEDLNCVAMHGASSCILPFAEEAIHRQPEPSRRAADYFLRYLEGNPDDVQARWLLNLTRMAAGDPAASVPERYRLGADAFAADGRFSRWQDLAPRLGVDTFDLAGGAVMDDFDGDGRLDLLTSSWDPCGPLRAFRNSGDGGFEDVTAAWGLDGQLGGLNLVHGDFDGDGQLDLLILRGAWLGEDGRIRNSLLRNDLRGKRRSFVDVTATAGLAYPAYPTQTAAWGDFDGDGDLDLYVGNESSSRQVYSWSLVENPGRAFPSQLFRNNGDRRSGVADFTDVARASGVTNMRFAKGVAWGDYDNDGDPDLYVSNMGPNRLYRNDGVGPSGVPRFVDVATDLGVTAPESASFATWFFDYDNDGDLDLFVADYSAPIRQVSGSYMGFPSAGGSGRPLIYRNEIQPGGVPRFREVSRELGLDRPLLPMGANYGDLDNDGWLDLVIGTGVPDLEALMPDAVYRNQGGRRFADVTFAIGLGHLQKGHGVAFGDLDNDGDQDILHQMGGAFPSDGFANALYENPGGDAHWLTLRLEGRRANRFAVGSRIEVQVVDETGAGEHRMRSIHRVGGSGGSFGGSSLQQEIGLGRASRIVRITVVWPGSGTEQHFPPVEMDRAYLATEGEPELAVLEVPRIELGGSIDND